MRQSCMNIEIITLDDGTPCGISLGADFCAQHEQGHHPLARALGLGQAGNAGLAQYLACPIAEDDARLSLYERKKATKTIAAEVRLTFHVIPEIAQRLAEKKPASHSLPAVWVEDGVCNSLLATSWGKDGLCIRAFGEAERQVTLDLHEAALKGDLLVSSSGDGGNPFARGGLCLTILSRMPQSVHDMVAAQEDERQRMQDAVDATGIEDTLKEAGLKWHALKPKWSDFFKTIIREMPNGERGTITRPETDHPVMFFLNPSEQSRFHHGWFTVEELEAWVRREGPVIKQVA